MTLARLFLLVPIAVVLAAWLPAGAQTPPPPAPAPSAPARQQTTAFPTSRGMAANVARMHAERINGGLAVYRAAACMHERSGGTCLIRSDDRGFLFRFLGGPPGWEPLRQPATKETEILIAPDGRTVVELIYNGSPRP